MLRTWCPTYQFLTSHSLCPFLLSEQPGDLSHCLGRFRLGNSEPLLLFESWVLCSFFLSPRDAFTKSLICPSFHDEGSSVGSVESLVSWLILLLVLGMLFHSPPSTLTPKRLENSHWLPGCFLHLNSMVMSPFSNSTLEKHFQFKKNQTFFFLTLTIIRAFCNKWE